VHGLAIAAWYVLFFAQSLLIGVRNRRLHFKLGWSAVGVGLAISSQDRGSPSARCRSLHQNSTFSACNIPVSCW
jgi:hypothetical protein